MGSSLGWDSELHVRDSAKGGTGKKKKKNHNMKVARVYFASKKTVNA